MYPFCITDKKRITASSDTFRWLCRGVFHVYTALSGRTLAPQADRLYMAMMAGSNLLLSSSERFFTRVLYVFTVCTE